MDQAVVTDPKDPNWGRPPSAAAVVTDTKDPNWGQSVAATTAAPSTAPWTKSHPNIAAAVKGTLETLPAAGAILGGVVATPESAGLATIPGVALGAGIGRGLRDLLAEGLGVDRPTTPTEKGARIALDTAETAAAQAILPGLWEAMKTPGKTVGEFIAESKAMLPKWAQAMLPHVPDALKPAPAAVLQRPAWQAWGDYLPKPSATEVPIDRYMPNVSGISATDAAAKVMKAASASKLQITAQEAAQGIQWARQGVPDTDILNRILSAREFNAKFKL